jgi:hypothetical protein
MLHEVRKLITLARRQTSTPVVLLNSKPDNKTKNTLPIHRLAACIDLCVASTSWRCYFPM